MITMKNIISATGLVALLWLNQAWAITPPDVLAKTTTQEVLAILKSDKELKSGNLNKAYELVEDKVLPHFDFDRMTQLAVGRFWQKTTPEQKKSLVHEFKNLLVRTYASALTSFTNQVVEFKPLLLKPDDTDVTVKTEVKQPGGQPIPIDYSMYKTDFGWKVYDVSIDGVSLVINYRASFGNTIRQSGVDGLIAMLRAKTASVSADGPVKNGRK
jgi:phospholipid transport system substrate-binding protein